MKKLLFIVAVLFFSCTQNVKKQKEVQLPVITAADTTKVYPPDDSLTNNEDSNFIFKKFVPEGYSILTSAIGNLNGDVYKDAILVLKKNGEDSTSDVIDNPEKRPLYILKGEPDGSFDIIGKNDNVVYCVNCGGVFGDPFTGVVIKNGYFSAEHYGGSNWRWVRTITFKYDKNDHKFYLHKDGNESYHTSEPDKIETKIYSVKDFGIVPFAMFDIYKDAAYFKK